MDGTARYLSDPWKILTELALLKLKLFSLFNVHVSEGGTKVGVGTGEDALIGVGSGVLREEEKTGGPEIDCSVSQPCDFFLYSGN